MEIAYPAAMIGSLILSIFFSGVEVAFLSANKSHIEIQSKVGNIGARIVTFFAKKPTWFVGTTLIGNIGSLILFGVFTTLWILSLFQIALSSLGLSRNVPINAI